MWGKKLVFPGRITHFNAWWGCTKWSEGCKNCYAETFSKRYKWDIWGPGKPRRTFEEKHHNQPLKWNREAMAENIRHTVFCGSMMDWCDEEAPEGEREKIWPVVKATPFLMWLMLTKRPERILECLPRDWSPEKYTNVALGCTIELDKYSGRADYLRAIGGVPHFISAEPLLGPLPSLNLAGIDWLIVGGESGAGWREMRKEWAIDLRDRCVGTDTTFFYKQSNGSFSGTDPYLEDKEYKAWPKRFSLPTIS